VQCTKCGNKAIIRISYANLLLCSIHFWEWFEQRVERTVKKYRMLEGSRVVAVAVSGGKDSTTLLHVLHKLSSTHGFEVIGINIDLGIDVGTRYSSLSTEFAIKNFEALGVKYRVVKLQEEYGFTIDEAKVKVRRPVCSTCGLVKRYVMERAAKEVGADTLATGHNLNDVAQFVMSGYHSGDVSNLARLRAVSPAENGYLKKIKPLFLSYEREITTYALTKGIPFIMDSCPHNLRVGGPTGDKLRRILEETEDQIPGFMFRLVENFEDRVRPFFEDLPKFNLGKCKVCGMPTNMDREICSFCAVRSRLLEGKRGAVAK
jgi:uncharacterized protein (TIGR00269 family)